MKAVMELSRVRPPPESSSRLEPSQDEDVILRNTTADPTAPHQHHRSVTRSVPEYNRLCTSGEAAALSDSDPLIDHPKDERGARRRSPRCCCKFTRIHFAFLLYVVDVGNLRRCLTSFLSQPATCGVPLDTFRRQVQHRAYRVSLPNLGDAVQQRTCGEADAVIVRRVKPQGNLPCGLLLRRTFP